MKAQRIFMPGSEWLYYKIYSGPKTLEQLLLNEIKSLTDSLLEQNIIDKFFYIRYSDPEYHLRIRFHIPDLSNFNAVIQTFKQAIEFFVDKRIIWKINIDSYNRELERYGSQTIEDIETLFFHNSMTTIHIISLTEGQNNDDRWIWGIKYVDMLLDQFGLNLGDKIALFELLSNGSSTVFNMNKSLKVSLDTKVRNNKAQVEEILNIDDEMLSPLYKILLNYINESSHTIDKILKRKNSKELEIEFNNLLGSIIHMHYNRLFRTQQRIYELVIYYFMHKFYVSMAARIKYNPAEKIVVS